MIQVIYNCLVIVVDKLRTDTTHSEYTSIRRYDKSVSELRQLQGR